MQPHERDYPLLSELLTSILCPKDHDPKQDSGIGGMHPYEFLDFYAHNGNNHFGQPFWRNEVGFEDHRKPLEWLDNDIELPIHDDNPLNLIACWMRPTEQYAAPTPAPHFNTWLMAEQKYFEMQETVMTDQFYRAEQVLQSIYNKRFKPLKQGLRMVFAFVDETQTDCLHIHLVAQIMAENEVFPIQNKPAFKQWRNTLDALPITSIDKDDIYSESDRQFFHIAEIILFQPNGNDVISYVENNWQNDNHHGLWLKNELPSICGFIDMQTNDRRRVWQYKFHSNMDSNETPSFALMLSN